MQQRDVANFTRQDNNNYTEDKTYNKKGKWLIIQTDNKDNKTINATKRCG